MQETMWSNSLRRKGRDDPSSLVSRFQCTCTPPVCTQTHACAHTPPPNARRASTPPGTPRAAGQRKPSAAETAHAFGPPGYNGTAARTARQVLGAGDAVGRGRARATAVEKANRPHLLPGALHDLSGNGVDLVVHFHRPLFPAADFHQQDPEIRSAEIKGQEVAVLYQGQEHKEHQKQLSASWHSGNPKTRDFQEGPPIKYGGDAPSGPALRLREGWALTHCPPQPWSHTRGTKDPRMNHLSQ